MTQNLTIEGKSVSVFPGRSPTAPVLYLNTFAGEREQVLAALGKSRLPDFSLVTISGLDWNHDMAPWDAAPVFKNADPCTGGADAYLQLLTGRILPAAERELPGVPCWRGLAGYSLAGLFAVYAIHNSHAFSRFASMSGSLWFPGFRDYVGFHPVCALPDCVYFSLGDKEEKARNPLLQTVRENTETIQAHYRALGICTTFVLHPGNHAHQAAQRTVAGLAWLLGQEPRSQAAPLP